MAGNPKTPKAIAPKSGRPAASTKGVMVGKNAGKGVVQSSAPKSAMTKYKMGGSTKMKGKSC
jgi:hypothetical protein